MCGTVRLQVHSNMQPGKRSTSDARFIRISPLLLYLHTHFLHIWHIYSPDVKRSASLTLKTRHCAVANFVKHATWWNIHLRPHVYKGFPFISLSTPHFLHIWHISSPVVKRSASLKLWHCANARLVKHATWWKIHFRPHVYKGFPFISLSTPRMY